MRVKLLIAASIICCSLYSCIKAPVYPIVPHIEFENVAYPHVQSGSNDSIIITFTDGDGDIGVSSNQNDTSNLCGLQHGDSSEFKSLADNIFLIDSRTNCISPFASGTITTTGKYKGVSGEISVLQNVYSTKCIVPTSGCPDDTVIYTIVIKDKAGHMSNFVQTSPIIISNQP